MKESEPIRICPKCNRRDTTSFHACRFCGTKYDAIIKDHHFNLELYFIVITTIIILLILDTIFENQVLAWIRPLPLPYASSIEHRSLVILTAVIVLALGLFLRIYRIITGDVHPRNFAKLDGNISGLIITLLGVIFVFAWICFRTHDLIWRWTHPFRYH